jgi:uncharacterized protein YodC (DUF2158 family)
MNEKFSIGDFVRLAIGGEAMVLVKPDGIQEGNWICSWVDRDGNVQLSSVNVSLLKYIGPSHLK